MVPASLGRELLAIARKTVHSAFSNENYRMPPELRKRLSAENGVFVNIYRGKDLRGSFGYPPGSFSLADGIKRAARGAAFMDPRFQPLKESEFNNVTFEVAIIEKMRLLKVMPKEYSKNINPKKHGLFIQYGPFKAMQLPVFAARRKLSSRDFLEKTIEKSGLAPEMWQSPNMKVYTFATALFSE